MTGLISAKLYSEHSQVPFVPYRVVLKDERPPAIHRVMIWCKLGVLIKWLNWTHTSSRHCGQVGHRTSNVDIAAKRRKKHKNTISGLVISMGYETEIREF